MGHQGDGHRVRIEMPVTLTPVLEGLRTNKTHRFATCWKIEREDGVILYFTNHNHKIDFDGQTYTPAGGFNASAIQKQTSLRTDNLEIVGMLTSGAITEEDLIAGRYTKAKVTAQMVDWKFPWMGAFQTAVYWIIDVKFTGEVWHARMEGLTRWLRPKVGDVYGRECRHQLGDTQCGVSLGPITESGTVQIVAAQAKRKIFNASGLTTPTTGYFDYGKLTWTSGANNGLEVDVKAFTIGTNFELQLNLPFDIVVNDTFDVIPGCNKTIDHCKDKFEQPTGNFVNFGGFPFIPGTDRMAASPSSR